MKENYYMNPFGYWNNRIKIYRARRNSYKQNSTKWLKYDALKKKAEYNLATWKFNCRNFLK